MSIIEFTGTGGDDTAGLMGAIASATTRDRIILHGVCGTTTTLIPPCSVEGDDPDDSILKAVPGSGVPSLLSIADKSGLRVRNLGFLGEDVYNAASPAAALGVGANTVATFDQVVEGCTFANFKADYWLLGHSTAPMRGLKIRNCRFATVVGNIPVIAPGSPNGGGLIVLYGDAGGGMMDTEVSGNVIDGTGAAFGIVFYGNHERFSATGNQIDNMGFGTAVGQNNYGILIYDTVAAPTDGIITGNIITNPAAAGIYAAGASQITIDGNKIRGQYRTDDASLPRGAISINGVAGGFIGGNDLLDNFYSISVAGGSPGTPPPSDLFMTGNRIMTRAGGSPFGFFFDGVTLSLNGRIAATVNDIWMYSGASTAFGGNINGSGDIFIMNNTVRAQSLGLTSITGANVNTSGNIWIA